MVICDTNIISKLLFRDPLVLKQIDMIGLKNIYITPVVYIEIIHLKHFKLIKDIILYEEK
ncbi:hypothetical protein [Capnocytophaga leadbetteri]|uniref:hypothetical protein n=1 Tax=Capnocytophaga leadbetteri TaxID=327575 RepID=UPI0028EFE95C|nr:hypothetical protein [Capnocytophaga leadbetteri]